jgi:hypothetical protein
MTNIETFLFAQWALIVSVLAVAQPSLTRASIASHGFRRL